MNWVVRLFNKLFRRKSTMSVGPHIRAGKTNIDEVRWTTPISRR